jgi:hypothetical protein
MACVAAITFAACSGDTSGDTPDNPAATSTASTDERNTPSANPTAGQPTVTVTASAPSPLFTPVKEVKGDIAPLKKNADGTITCGPGDKAVKVDISGRVRFNDQIISTAVDGEVIAITITPDNDDFLSGYVNRTQAFLIEPEGDETPPDTLAFEPPNFSGKKITEIVLCG